MASRYHDVYGAWRADPEAFWAEAARDIDWIKPPSKVFDANRGVYGRWFPDATCNTCYNALDRHVDGGRGDAGRADLRQPRHRRQAHIHVSAKCATKSPRSPPCCRISA